MRAMGKEYDITYTSYSSHNPITHIARKVYYDNQLSCFFYIKNISRYLGQVHLRPEILHNIDELFPRLKLSQKWCQQSKSYEIKFYAPINDFATYSFCEEGQSVCLSMINEALEVASDMNMAEIFAYLKPSAIIPYKNILYINEIPH